MAQVLSMLPVDVIIHRGKFGDDNILEEQEAKNKENTRVTEVSFTCAFVEETQVLSKFYPGTTNFKIFG
jgi:hypothetical protein